jgi:hypothetical protein
MTLSMPGIIMPRKQVGTERVMRIGILGSGFMGGKLGTIFARAGTPREAADGADALSYAGRMFWFTRKKFAGS